MSDSDFPDDFEVKGNDWKTVTEFHLVGQLKLLLRGLDKDSLEKKADDFDDSLLRGRIQCFIPVQNEDYFDHLEESKDEKKTVILKTIVRQFSSGNPSKEALLFAAYGFAKYVEAGNGVDSLDEAFFPKPKLKQGGQPISDSLRRKVCAAYQNVIFHRTIKYEYEKKGDEIIKMATQFILTREHLDEAELAATIAYYTDTKEGYSEDKNYDDSFKKTILPILKKGGVYIGRSKLQKQKKGK
jgi:hypothetical protein